MQLSTRISVARGVARGGRRRSAGLTAFVAAFALSLAFAGVAQASTTTWTSAHYLDTNGGTMLSDSCASTTQCVGIDFNGQEVTFNPT
jgi:hypothetical protein